MAKLTARQKSNITAKWHTGQYTKTELAKMYRVDESSIRLILDKQPAKNADVVEAQIALELYKNSEKTPKEIVEINKIVEKRLKEVKNSDNLTLKVYENQVKAIDLIGELLNKKTKKSMTKVKKYTDGGQICGEEVELFEIDLEPKDLLNCVEAIDKASLTLKVNERHAPKAEMQQLTSVTPTQILFSKDT